jgi:hypothetical protein
MAVLTSATASHRQMYQGQPGTTVSTLYTAPANNTNVTAPSSTAYIKEIIIANTTATAATITLHVVPSGGTVGLGTQTIPTVTIGGNDSKILTGLNTAIPPGGTIQGLQGTASAVTVTISGTEVQ